MSVFKYFRVLPGIRCVSIRIFSILVQPLFRTDIPKSSLSFVTSSTTMDSQDTSWNVCILPCPSAYPCSDTSLLLDLLEAWDLTSFGRRLGSAYFHENMGADMKGRNCAHETRDRPHRCRTLNTEDRRWTRARLSIGSQGLYDFRSSLYPRQQILLSIPRFVLLRTSQSAEYSTLMTAEFITRVKL
ncbi:hypothetical protein ARMGADRAFT_56630 [Armillaria gallica]|uniref:Uncharacterized protein n=1 Tax=Armillaria gallica TaxID=47427 RepID=A0A2H3EN21_ARMGA|nr:hypothetical protein ARMGADRAFT_56630 [Armillaria gallica]